MSTGRVARGTANARSFFMHQPFAVRKAHGSTTERQHPQLATTSELTAMRLYSMRKPAILFLCPKKCPYIKLAGMQVKEQHVCLNALPCSIKQMEEEEENATSQCTCLCASLTIFRCGKKTAPCKRRVVTSRGPGRPALLRQ